MTILLVDDEHDIIEGMLAGIDFETLGITKVYTAFSAQEARIILSQHPVDILLTDIEMPGESGLDFLTWLSRQNQQIVTVFCTNFANFDYAKKAVELHCFDYYLKPIAYEDLQEHLAAAVLEVQKTHHASAYQQMGEYWLQGQAENKRSFWRNIFTATMPLAEIVRKGTENGITYGDHATFTLCYIHVRDKKIQELEKWKVYGFRNVAEEVFDGADNLLETMLSISGNWVMVLDETAAAGSRRQALLSTLLRQTEELFDVSVNAYYLEHIPLEKAQESYREIVQVASQDVLRKTPLLDVIGYTPPKNSYSPTLIAGWAQRFMAGKITELYPEVSALLERCKKENTVSAKFLKSFRADIQQMAFAELERKGINAHILFDNLRYDQLLALSLDSIEAFKAYLHYLLQRTEEQIHFTSQAGTMVGRIKSYVQEHLSEDINRANVAKQFFLNPDYLARLFKKETGQTLGSYLQEQRIMEAKKLLCKPGLPVSEIAQMVGYDNYSYFSHFFHEKTGMSPSQFRKSFAL
ncbi:helix-turn-helix domain-containing protein [Acutalibacter caecimuris]|uniref:helix-turn-helix domain-containing protein n=1 Tax=Acutalibacter caecimuris TaxID=3093657 RepID=UPI002AC96F15|nr:helix-turn-helix domain-containing protein [Acutalibacter sp. M00118]